MEEIMTGILLDSHDMRAVGELARASQIKDVTRIFNLAAGVTAECLRQMSHGRSLRVYNNDWGTIQAHAAFLEPAALRKQMLSRLTDSTRYRAEGVISPAAQSRLNEIQQMMKLESAHDALRFSLAFTAAVNGALHAYSGATRLAVGDSWETMRTMRLPFEKSARALVQRAGNCMRNIWLHRLPAPLC
jgi:hypothetical protein